MDDRQAEHERFPNPPLRAMLGQVRFPPILRIAQRDFITRFQDAIRPEFPEFEERTQFGILVGPQGPLQQEPTKQWRFTTADGSWSVVLATDFISVEAEADSYTDFEEFRRRVEYVWPSVVEHIQPARRVQQGLRYINHLEGNGSAPDWRRLVNPDLMGLVGTEGIWAEAVQTSSDYRFHLPDGTLVVKHGVVRAGPDRVPGYLLDFDYHTQRPGGLSSEEVLSVFDGFHDVIYPVFRMCVTEEALSEFRRAEPRQ